MSVAQSLNVLLVAPIAIISIVILDARAHKLIVLRHGGRPHTIDALRHRSVGYHSVLAGYHASTHYGQRPASSLRLVLRLHQLDS